MLNSASFAAMGTQNIVTARGAERLTAALGVARRVVVSVDATCSRFCPDSELSLLNYAAGSGPVRISPLLGCAVDVALQVAADTRGLVDPTVGPALIDLGYDRTFSQLDEVASPLGEVRKPLRWTAVDRDVQQGTLTMPAGCGLDLGATGKAWAADEAAREAAEVIEDGVVVCCGGDAAFAGAPPREGWRVRIEDADGSGPVEEISVFEGGVATSSPSVRRWRRGDRVVHHILDPRSGMPAESPWELVTVVAASAAAANAASTAAVILGEEAPFWLASQQLPARLVRRFSHAVIHTPAWPQR